MARNVRIVSVSGKTRKEVLQEAGLLAPATPAWLPEGAVAFADFVNGRYFANGAETTIGAMFEQNDDWGPWDGSANIGNIGGGPIFSSPGSVLTDGATVVIWGISGSTDGTEFGVALGIMPTFSAGIFALSTFAGAVVSAYPSYNLVSDGSETEQGPRRAAITFTPAKLSLSVAGAPVVTTSNAGGWDAFNAFGFQAAGDGTIHGVAVYAPLPDADLPALSAL